MVVSGSGAGGQVGEAGDAPRPCYALFQHSVGIPVYTVPVDKLELGDGPDAIGILFNAGCVAREGPYRDRIPPFAVCTAAAGELGNVLGDIPAAAVLLLHGQSPGEEGIEREGDLDILIAALEQRQGAVGGRGIAVRIQAARTAVQAIAVEGVELELRFSLLIQLIGHELGKGLVYLLVETSGTGWVGGLLFLFQSTELFVVKDRARPTPIGVQEGERSILQNDGYALFVIDAVPEAGYLAALVVGGGEGGELDDGFGGFLRVAGVHRQEADMVGGVLSGNLELLPVVHAHVAQLQGPGPVTVVREAFAISHAGGVGKDGFLFLPLLNRHLAHAGHGRVLCR